MAKVKEVIARAKDRQEIDKLVIMTAKAKECFRGSFAFFENPPKELLRWKEAIENAEVVVHSVDCANTLFMIVKGDE